MPGKNSHFLEGRAIIVEGKEVRRVLIFQKKGQKKRGEEKCQKLGKGRG